MANRQFSTAFSTAFEPLSGDGFVVTDTDILQLPIDVVMAGHQPYKSSGRTWEIPADRRTQVARVRSTPSHRLKGPTPSFETVVSKRGY